jgi:hypothetical protein
MDIDDEATERAFAILQELLKRAFMAK